MHIAYITPEFPTEIIGGGLSTYLGNISRILAAKGNKVTIITLSDKNGSFIYKENIYVERVYPYLKKLVEKKSRFLLLFIYSFWLNLRLFLLSRNETIDIVQYPNYLALGIFRSRIPSVIRISSDSCLWRNAKEKKFVIKNQCETKADKLEDIAMKRVDSIYGPSKLIAELIGKRIIRKITIIESPYIKVRNSDKSLYDKKLSDKLYFLTACSLSRAKGIVTIADAIYTLLNTYPEVYYVFAGANDVVETDDGQVIKSVDYIKKKAKQFADRIIYLGSISRDQLSPIILHAKAVILPSRIDNLPNSCIEAMGEGKIVIGTNGASFEQLIVDGKNGLLMQRDSARSLIMKVDELMAWDEKKIIEVGEAAKKRITLMDADKIGDEVLNFYETVIKRKKKNTK